MALNLGLGPIIRRRNERGVFFHWPYRNLKMSLPGLINPKGKTKNRSFYPANVVI